MKLGDIGGPESLMLGDTFILGFGSRHVPYFGTPASLRSLVMIGG